MASNPTVGTWSAPKARARGAWVLEQLMPSIARGGEMLAQGLVGQAEHERGRAERLADLTSSRQWEAAGMGVPAETGETMEGLQARIGGEMAGRRERAELREAQRLANLLSVEEPSVDPSSMPIAPGMVAGEEPAPVTPGRERDEAIHRAQYEAAVDRGRLDPRAAPFVRVVKGPKAIDPLELELMRARIEKARAEAGRARRPSVARPGRVVTPLDVRRQAADEAAKANQAALARQRDRLLAKVRAAGAAGEAALDAMMRGWNPTSEAPPPGVTLPPTVTEADLAPPVLLGEEDIEERAETLGRQVGVQMPGRARPRKPDPLDFPTAEAYSRAKAAWRAGGGR